MNQDNKNGINWVSEINKMRFSGRFNFPKDENNNTICSCGEKVFPTSIRQHLKSIKHNSWVSNFLKNQLSKPYQFTEYICTHGIHKGYKLEDVINADPGYIHFLIRKFNSTFPNEFKEALKSCGLEF